MNKISLVFSGEFFFAAFLLAGYFKGGIPWFPVDITIFCLCITLIIFLTKIYKKQIIIPRQVILSTLIFVAFTAIILCSCLITESEIYRNEKTARYLLITSWSFLGVYALINNRKSLEKFINSIIVIASIVSIVGFVDVIGNLRTGTYVGTICIMNTNYLAFGRTVGLGLIMLISSKWFKGGEVPRIYNILILIMATVILLSGGKMALIATVCSLLAIMVLATRVGSKKMIIVNKGVLRLTWLFFVALIVLIPVYLSGSFDDIFWRMISFFSGGDESTLMRVTLCGTAIDMIKESPLIGTGWASFPLYFYGIDAKVYSHNIFLELFSELGIFGLTTFLLLLIYAIYNGFVKFKKTYHKYNNFQYAIIGGFLFFLLNANSTGDITDNKILFTFVALLTISNTINKFEEKDIKSVEVQTEKKLIRKKKFRNYGGLDRN